MRRSPFAIDRKNLASACALVAAPARADVLEIGDSGAQWIAGGPVMPIADQALPVDAAAIELAVDYAVPVTAYADPALHAASVPTRYSAKVQELAARFDLSPALIEALVWQESRWREGAVSPVGARGLAQLMPGTARYLGVNPDDPFANLEGGARYLRDMLNRFEAVHLALAAYNAGPGAVSRARGIPRNGETPQYVRTVLSRWSAIGAYH